MSAENVSRGIKDCSAFDASLTSRGRMTAAVACALAEMAALEQEVSDLVCLHPEQGDAVHDVVSSRRMTAGSSAGEIHDFSKSKREEIARTGDRVFQASSQNAMAWNVWHRLGRFTTELNPQAYLGRIDGFFDKTRMANKQGLKEIEEAFDEIWQIDKSCAQRVEEALALLKTAQESIRIISAAMK
jgi:hypothetical protein